MKITFTKRHVVQQGDGKGPVYEKGETHDFEGFVAESYARKYVERGFAIDYVAPPPAPAPEPEPQSEPEVAPAVEAPSPPRHPSHKKARW